MPNELIDYIEIYLKLSNTDDTYDWVFWNGPSLID